MSQEVEMTTMTQRMAGFVRRDHHPARVALLVLFFWFIAAALVISVHAEIEPFSPMAGAALNITALLLVAYVYTRSAARQSGIAHALGVGSTWLLLSIAAEITITAHQRHAWFALLGSPERPLLRNVFLFAWVFAPALFARRESP
jgi:hypothetical protein